MIAPFLNSVFISLRFESAVIMQENDNGFCDFSVNIMAEKLDPEQLGVITLNSFLEEFYSTEKPDHDAVQSFIVYHYNGLPRSSLNNKVTH